MSDRLPGLFYPCAILSAFKRRCPSIVRWAWSLAGLTAALMQHWRSHLVLRCWRVSTYLRIDKHHGLGKTEDPNYFIAQDIVLTTYGIGEFVLPHPMDRWPSSPTYDSRHIRIRGVYTCLPVACLSLPSNKPLRWRFTHSAEGSATRDAAGGEEGALGTCWPAVPLQVVPHYP